MPSQRLPLGSVFPGEERGTGHTVQAFADHHRVEQGHAVIDSYAVYEEHIKFGRARALAVTSVRRMQALAQIPTVAEAGVKGYGQPGCVRRDITKWAEIVRKSGATAV